MRKNKRQGGGAALKAVGMSDIGKCRKNNEDAYYISAGEDPAENLYLVADGMGGCNAGEIASSCAIEGFLEHFWKEMKHAENDDMLDLMTSAVAAANRTVYEKSNSDREFAEMGTTIVAAAVREEKLYGGQQSLPFSQKGDAAPHHRPFLCDGAGEDGEHYEGGSGNAPQKKRDYARHWDSGYRGDGYGDSSRAEGRHRLALYRWAFRYAEG